MTDAPTANPARGIALMMGALALFALLDALSKGLAARHPVPVVVWGRYFMHFLVTLLVFLPRHGVALFHTPHPGLQLVRGLMLVTTSAMVVMAFQRMPLAEVTALIFIAPLLLTILAVKFLGERMPAWQWLPVTLGFSGVLFIVRPSGDFFGPGAFLALGGACAYSVYQLLTRKLSAVERSATQSFYTALIGTMVLSVALPWFWVPGAIGWRDGLLIASLGLIAAFSHLLLIMAFRVTPASILSPFTYAQLVWAMLFGWILFDDLPDGTSLIGMAIIVGAGVVVAYAERLKAMRKYSQAGIRPD